MSNPQAKSEESAKYKWIGTRPDRPDGADKVTGRARFGADFNLPGQLIGKVLRSPHPHAIIKSIDTRKAEALRREGGGHGQDFPEQPNLIVPTGEMQVNLRDVTRNVMAREKALYEGHPVAAVAAVSEAIAKEALALIKVEYKVLPHVIDVADAMKPNAPTPARPYDHRGRQPAADQAVEHRQAHRVQQGRHQGGLRRSRGRDRTRLHHQAVHQGYIEPHAALASASEDGQVQVWSTTQGHFQVRGFCAKLLNIDTSQVRVTPTEIGGGFGGKTVVYLEPLAIRCRRSRASR
jgi:Aerobic-type carbon monoxide dehydrogenase, large subunit CoxL/CutL homologs